MRYLPIVCSDIEAELDSAPINADWIVDGSPVARNCLLSRSADGDAWTLVWDCTPGKFYWIYDKDETIHILKGDIVLDDGHGATRRLGPGDVVFFPRGARVLWHVQSQVRKLAFFRRCPPRYLSLINKIVRRAQEKIVQSRGVPKWVSRKILKV